MTVAAVPVALAVGLVIGALGGGGAILTVPALVHLLGQTPHQATTSSLVIVGVTSLIALVPHAREGHVRVGQGVVFAVVATGGTVAGSTLSASVPDDTLLALFAVLMLLVAVLMARKALSRRRSTQESEPTLPMLTLRPLRCECPRVAKVFVTATVVGLLTGLLGVGGGFVLVPALVLALTLPMPTAVGTSLLVIALNSATALGTRVALAAPDIDWDVTAAFAALAVVGSLAGARLSGQISERAQTAAFAALLLAVGLYTAAGALT